MPSSSARVGLGVLTLMGVVVLFVWLRPKLASRTQTPQVSALAAVPQPSAPTDYAADLAPSALDLRAAGSSCTATPHGAFHLRPRPERKSSGPELPKRTRLRVLEQIVGPDTERRGLSLYRIEVEADHRQGYAYLRPGELARTCPLLWPHATHLVMNEPFKLQIDAEDENCLLPGPAKRLEDLLSKNCKANRASLNKAKRLDVDGDKRPDRLVEVGRVLAILRNRATGWVADPISILHEGSNREEHVWQDTLIAGEAVYVRSVDYAWENFPDETNDDGSVIPAERDQSNTAALFRVLADGQVYQVFEHFYSGDVGECNFTGHQDQSVTLRCSQGRVRLRWDEKLKRLIPTLDAK